MQDKWWAEKADEIQGFAESNKSKQFFSSIKAVFDPSKSGFTPLLASDGTTLIKEKTGITNRWREHLSQLLNRPSTVDQTALDQIEQQPELTELDVSPTTNEITKAIKQMSFGKAPGKDGIPAEVYKALSDDALSAFHSVLVSIWEEEELSADLHDATIVALFKNKVSRAYCGIYRSISLLSIAGKILARIILNRLIPTLSDSNLPESQCGFRPNRSTIDMVFAIRQVQEKCIEQNMNLYAVFIDLTKAFDTVNREALWIILRKLGCPLKFTTLIKLFHQDMTGEVFSSGEPSESFGISNGVKQGCVIAPVLFNLFFTQVLNYAIKDLKLGVYISQHQISATFGKWNRHINTTIGETLDDLCNGRSKISDIETIKVVKKDGKWYTIDNRRLWVFHHLEAAGKCTEIPVEEVQYCSLTHGRKFSSTNGGKSVTYIRGRSPGGTCYKRLKPVTPVEQKENKPTHSQGVSIKNTKSNSEKDKPPSAFSVSRPIHDIINTKGTMSQTAVTGLSAPCHIASKAAAANKCEISAPSDKTVVTSSRTSVFNDFSRVNRDDFIRRMRHIWSGKPLRLIDGAVRKSIRLFDNSKYTFLNEKCYQNLRYKPYSRLVANRHHMRHSRYTQQFEERHRIKYCKWIRFTEEETENEDYYSSENDWLDDDIAMFVDEREITEGNEDENSGSDDNKDSKEMDYDDDPWSDDTDDDTSSEPEYDELDVWESDSDAHKMYRPFPDSEPSDFEDDFLIAKELENIEKKEELRFKNIKKSNYISNGSKTSATDSKLSGVSQDLSKITKSNDRTCFKAMHCGTQSEVRNCIPSLTDNLPSKGLTSDLAGLEHSSSVCQSTESPVSIGCTSSAKPDSLDSIAATTETLNSVDSLCSSSFSETSEAKLTSQSDTVNSISNSDSNYSVPVVSVAPTMTKVSLVDTITTSVSTPAVAPITWPCAKSEYISEESSIDTDLSDTEEDEDSEDCYFSLHYTFDDRFDKRRRAREIAMKKYGYDWFSSDSD